MPITQTSPDDHWVWPLYEKGLTLIPLGTAGEAPPRYLIQRAGGEDQARTQWPKTPRERWAEWQAHTPSHSQLEQWILKYPGCNFAIVTGKEINVVDCDNDEAVEFVRNNLTRTPWMVRTGKGAHFYYQVGHNLPIKNSADEGARLDTRGFGGYVVAPGSTHSTGRQYTLEVDPDWPIDSVSDLPMLSADDIDLIHRYQGGSAVSVGQGTKLSFDATKHAPGLESGVREGSRDANLTRMVGKWIQEGLAVDKIIAKALNLDKQNTPPLGEPVVLQKIQSVLGTHFRRHGEELAEAVIHEAPQAKGLLVGPAGLKASPPTWIIKGVMPTDSIGVLFGPSSGGKSFAAIDMALCIASGREWHGRKMNRPGAVIYVCGEGQQGIANRIRAWEKYHEVPVDNLPIRFTTAPVRFLDPSAKAALMEAVHAEVDALGDVVTIIIDTLNRNFGDGDENSTRDMTNFIDAVTDVHKDTAATVLIVHHTGLTDGDRARGNGSLKNACDFEIKHSMVSKEGDPDKVFALVGKKMKDGSEMAATQFSLKVVTLGLDEDGDGYGSCVIEQVPGDAVEGGELAESMTRGMGANQKKTKEILAEYRARILTNLPEIEQVTIERQDLIEVMKSVGCPPNKTADWISRAVKKGFLSPLNSLLFEVTKNVTIG